ncbi:hypothetical protein C8R46DRAFT_1363850 [Mycena filopes]|nr:hypothetical protein C8R46DRAFT_1363850 [Mycena filopes]
MLDHLAVDRARVAELEAQILPLQGRLRNLELERHRSDRTQERLDSYHYPVLTLPNEITAEIFTHFLPDYPLRSPLAGIESPTLLTHICRAWRDIAIGTPALCRSMSLTENIPVTSQVEIVDLWIRRSRSCPLTIHVSAENDGSGPPFANLRRGGALGGSETLYLRGLSACWRREIWKISVWSANGGRAAGTSGTAATRVAVKTKRR